MGKAVDAAAPDDCRATFVPKLLESPQIKQQGLGVAIQMCQKVAARLYPELKLVLLRPWLINRKHGVSEEMTLTFSRSKAEQNHGVSDQQNSLRTHGQRAYLEQYRIDFLDRNAKIGNLNAM